jgi:putative transposase
VTGSPRPRDDERAILIALHRYDVIAELVDAELQPGETVEKIREIVARTWYLPGRGPRRVCERTVYKWLRLFRRGGLDALRPSYRKDRGTMRALDQALIERAAQLRREQPHRWTRVLLDILRLEGGLATFAPHRSTLDRHLVKVGASRRLLSVLGERRTIKMQFDRFGELWVGDYHHGPIVLGPDGRPTTAKLGAFIDHATRYPVADRYYLAEDSTSLRDTLLRALLRFGPAEKAYADRGAVYRAEQLRWSLRRIGCVFVHSRAYYSQGRGVIERWWQLADAFEQEVAVRPGEPPTIDELNRLWSAFRERLYCDAIHSELGRTPNQAIAEVVPKPLDPDVARELFLVRADRTVHRNDACVSVEGIRFLCDAVLRRQKVQVRYDPRDLSSVLIFRPDGERLQQAFPQPVNATPEPHRDPPAPPAQSVDYLALIREDYDRKLVEHARPLAYSQLDVDPTFDLPRCQQVLVDLAGWKPTPQELQELAAFWQTFGPLPEPLTRIAIEHAVRLNGRGRHLRIYLHAVRTLVLAHWKSKESP